jgi:hypothetical protein
MFHRAAATTAAILAPFGIALTVPVLSSTGGVPAAMAGADNASPGDDLTDENGQPTPPPAPPPTTPPVTPPVTPPTPAPVLPELPPKPADTLEDSGSPATPGNSNGNSGNPSSSMESGNDSSSHNGTIESQRLSVTESNTRTVSDTGAIPQGGVQAGGGGTAPSLKDAGSSEGALGAAAGLVILVTGTGLVLRRRAGVTAE